MNKIKSLSEKMAQKSEVRARMIMTVGTVLLVYMAVSTCQALWQSYQLNQELASLREKNTELRLHNRYLQNLIAYRRTDAFKDKEARAKLNYQRAGEVVLIIPEDDLQRFSEGNVRAREEAAERQRELTNPEKWWQVFFGAKEEPAEQQPAEGGQPIG